MKIIVFMFKIKGNVFITMSKQDSPSFLFFVHLISNPVWLRERIQRILFMKRTAQSEKYLYRPSSAHLPCCLITVLRGTGLWAGPDGNRSSLVLAGSLLFCPGGKCNVQTAREACQGAGSINFYLLTVFG